VNENDGGYEHVLEYIPITTPTAETISKLSEIRPGEDYGDRKLVDTLPLTRSTSILSTSHRCYNCRSRDSSATSYQQKNMDSKDGVTH
jgi:hypothetical protein